MPVSSMTGYANGQQTVTERTGSARSQAEARLAVELRSVNSRFLDLGFRLPDELRQHEPALRELLGKRLGRGKVELRAHVEYPDAASLAEPQASLLRRLAKLQEQVRLWLPDAQSPSVSEVLRLSSSSANPLAGSVATALLPLAGQVLDHFVAAREREGARLAGLLHERITRLRELASQAVPLVPLVVEAQKQRFLSRWNEALAGTDGGAATEAGQERALAEATAFAIRIDVAEELGRLLTHLDEIAAVLDKGGEVGKRLDFLIQELHREANTLGSKSATLELTRISVDMRVLIEQMREQVQNIE